MKKIKIEIKNRWTGKVLFEYESKDNTIKNTVIRAVNSDADLRGAYLRGAYLGDADLRGAYLGDADLRGADLRGAYLGGADLGDADLGGADLGDADLRGADLGGADLGGAISQVKHTIQIIPEEGRFTAYKKLGSGCIAKIEIPSKAKRTCNFKSRKCRAEYVKVIAITDRDGNKVKSVGGWRDSNFIYEVGKIVKADKFNNDIRLECTNGIHFFVTEYEAKQW